MFALITVQLCKLISNTRLFQDPLVLALKEVGTTNQRYHMCTLHHSSQGTGTCDLHMSCLLCTSMAMDMSG